MAVLSRNNRNKLWFGTVNRMEWFPTPNRGADVSASGWDAGGDLLSGGNYQFGSFDSAKNYVFEWPSSSSRETAQKMESYANGSYGRSLIYFVDPLTYTTNIFPSRWADPSITLGLESNPLVPGASMSALPTSANPNLNLPVQSVAYDLSNIGVTSPALLDDSNSVFLPAPEGFSLVLGAFYSSTGSAGVFYAPVALGGGVGVPVRITPLDYSASFVTNTVVSLPSGSAGVRVWVGKTSAGSATITLSAMTARLIHTQNSTVSEVARNLFTNPRLVGDGTWAEVRRNLCTNPSAVVNTAGWSGATRVVGAAPLVLSQHFRLAAISASQLATFSFASTVGVKYKLELYMRSAVAARVDMRDSIGIVTVGVNKVRPDWELVTVSGTARETLSHLSVRADGAGDIDFAAVLVEISDGSRNFFDGSTMDSSMSQPEDFRVRWLGTPNASESVMEIERVRGLTAVRCIAGVSTKARKPAMRLIPTGGASSETCYVAINGGVPAAARALGTFIGTLHATDASASTAALRNTLRSANPQQVTPSTHGAGSFEHRLSIIGNTDGAQAALYGDGAASSRHTWWTDIGLYAGDYTGPVFNGSSPPNGTIVYSWAGTPDNSESVATSIPRDLTSAFQGPWAGGQGNSGVRFAAKPTIVNMTGVNGGQVQFAASFREVGSWVLG